MDWLGRIIVAVVKAFIASITKRLQRDEEKKQEGREEVIENAHQEADDRKAQAQQMDDEWAGLTPDDRERLRNERGVYRD